MGSIDCTCRLCRSQEARHNFFKLPGHRPPASFVASPARERPSRIGGVSLDQLRYGRNVILEGALSGWGVEVGRVVPSGPCVFFVAGLTSRCGHKCVTRSNYHLQHTRT
jgi:hypothetical protein